MAILSANEVHYSYKSKYQTVHAVRGVTYNFESGKFYAIVGKSGCGKTTFLSMLAGLDLPSDGAVEFGGKTTAELNRDKYRMDDVALICQSFNLFPLLTVLENVMYPMTLRGISAHKAKETAKEKLAAVGLDETYYKRLPDMLSGGEQQRVAIARALAKNPKIVLCDEPTGALDYQTGKNVLALLQDTCRDTGKTVIVITHNAALTAMADRVVRVRNGAVASVEVNSSPVPVEEIEW